MLQNIKFCWKTALKSGKIVKRKTKLYIEPNTRSTTTIAEYFSQSPLPDEVWSKYKIDKRLWRSRVASKPACTDEFICQEDYSLWKRVIRLLSSIFWDQNGNFRHEKHEDEPWSYNFIHFCNRVLRTLPSEENYENESESPIELLRRRLLYVKGTIQPFLSAHSSQHNCSDGVVPKEKLCELWVRNKKKAIEILKNCGVKYNLLLTRRKLRNTLVVNMKIFNLQFMETSWKIVKTSTVLKLHCFGLKKSRKFWILAQTIQRVEKMVCIIKILKQNGIKLQMRYEMFLI